MDAMAAANHGDELKFPGLGSDCLPKRSQIFEQDIGGLNHLDGESSVDNIAAGQAKMEPTAGGLANVFGDVCCERDDVVVENPLQFLAALQRKDSASFHLSEVFFG